MNRTSLSFDVSVPRHTLHIDIETYSSVDLAKYGVYRYVESPDFLILMAAWSLDGGPVQVATTRDELRRIPHLLDPAAVKIAHNASFERVCFSAFYNHRPGSYLDPEQYHDTMAVAAEYGYPKKLGPLAKALGGEQKDEAGTRLINFFCKPNRKGERNLPEDHPEEWAEFVEYCRQDVVTLLDVDKRLGDFPTETERAVYMTDQRINDRGMAVDVEMAAAAAEAAEDNRMLQELEFTQITGVAKPGSREPVLDWFARNGAPLRDLTAETVEAATQRDDLKPKVRRALELRQDLALVAAKKYDTALNGVNSDGRLRGGFRFFGAHTGRWAGRGVQPHNLPREQFETETETEAAILDLKLGLGASSLGLKAMVRALFTGPLTVVDYAAIEARVIAWLAGEQWALDAFYAGRDIYVETAGRMGSQYTRSQGKVAVLALGFAGGVNSLRVMGATGNDRALQNLVSTWREANPAIVDLWSELGAAFRLGGEAGGGEKIVVELDGKDRAIRLPSGRALVYHDVRTAWEDTGFGRRLAISFRDPKNGYQVRTYGGRLTENITQAVARDVLAEALVRLDRAKLPVVAHVHDEILVEGTDVERVKRIMTQVPAWAEGLPIDGAGFTCRRYRKD